MCAQFNSEETYDAVVNFITSGQDHFYRFVFTYTKNEQASLDIVQNAIYLALTKYRALRNITYLKTWFYRILINESLSYLRKNKKFILVDEIIDTKGYSDRYELDDINLFNHINNLPEKMKVIILLRFYEEMTLEEIAQITKTNVNTVKSRLYKGLKILRLNVEEFENYE